MTEDNTSRPQDGGEIGQHTGGQGQDPRPANVEAVSASVRSWQQGHGVDPADPGPIVPSPGPAGPAPTPEVPVPDVPAPAPADPVPPAPQPLQPEPDPAPAPTPAPSPGPTPVVPAPQPIPPAPVPDAGPASAPAPAGPVSSVPAPTPDQPPATEIPAGVEAQDGRSRPADWGRPGARRGGGRPAGHPGGRPGGRPPRVAGAATTPTVVEPVDPHQWGRIDDDGIVYVRTGDAEHPIGNWQAGDAEAGLAHFGRRFDDFSVQIAVLEARLASGTGDPKTAKQQAISLREQVPTLTALGDLDSAAARLEVVIGAAEQAIAGASRARANARAAAITAKEALCAEAEQLAESTQWKSSGDRLKAIVDQWRQIHGVDRKADDALWKRFAKARDTFTRHRGSHFAELDKQRAEAKDVKEALIKKAEELADSSDWGETASSYRDLMTQWKAAGRAPRDVEDSLWDRFRAAQERFFSRRNQVFSERDAEFEANAAKKQELLVRAEKLDPAKDLEGAKSALRSVQQRWEEAGKVPRERIRELDARLRAVEDRIRKAENSHWTRTDPETQARVDQFRSRVEQFRGQAAKARAAGNARKAKEAEAQAAQWEEWLKAAEGAVDG